LPSRELSPALVRTENMKILEDIAECLERGDSASLKVLIHAALAQNIKADDILRESLVRGMDALGVKFKRNEVFIPEVLIASRAMKAGLEILRPFLSEKRDTAGVTIVMGTVRGDLHDLGKKIVQAVLEQAGCRVLDLGVDVPKERFVAAIRKERPDIVGLSALLTTTMVYMNDVVEAVERAKLRKQVKIIIGGGPVTSSFAYGIRADGYAPDAFSALDLVKKLMEKKRRNSRSSNG